MRVKILDPFEFAAAIVLVSLLSVLACAAFGAPTRTGRAELLRSDLDGLFAQAGRRAVASGLPVVLCPVDVSFSCTGGGDWSRGWIGFTDENGNRQYDGDDELLRRDLPLPDGVRLYALAGRSHLRFEPRAGRMVTGGGFVVCDPRRPGEPIALKLSEEGRLRLETPPPSAAEQCAVKRSITVATTPATDSSPAEQPFISTNRRRAGIRVAGRASGGNPGSG